MSTAKTIAGIVPGLPAAALVGYNLKTLKQIGLPRRGRRMQRRPNFRRSGKTLVKAGVTNLIAIPLIGATSSMVNALE